MQSKKLKEGPYRGVLTLNKEAGVELPFNFEVTYKGGKPFIIIHNADERIVVDEIQVKGDSVNFKMPVFDTEFKTKRIGNNLEGVWINNYRSSGNIVPFKAWHGEQKRFLFEAAQPMPVFEGRWEVSFSPGGKDASKAIGVFHHQEQTDYLSATFLTETGDYRYLEGMRSGQHMYLSCFDGSHAFLFTAELRGDIISGRFYSGAHWQEDWTGRRNDAFKLSRADEITTLRDKKARLQFSFPSLSGKTVSLSDAAYANKPLILQIMGSWCPNCMDESLYLADIYRRYKAEGLEIIALAFEKTEDLEKARSQAMRMKNRLKMDYEILVTLKTGKAKASETFPMLNGISAFPTTIFLNKQHQVVKIHTGFSGPATGGEYEDFKQSTELIIKNLLKE